MLKYDKKDLDYMRLLKEFRKLDFKKCQRKIKLAVLCDAAPQYFTPLFKTLFHKNGIEVEIYEAEYDTIELEIFDPNSGLYTFRPDYVVILNHVSALRTKYYATKTGQEHFAESQANKMAGLWDALRKNTKAPVLQSNFVLPCERSFGNFDLRQPAPSFFGTVSEINRLIAERARSAQDVFINDVDYIASLVGRERWFDEKMWVLSKAFAAFEFLPRLVQNIVDVVLSLLGSGVKCVVLDLDNTLWGGIIGDDGLEGIRLGHFEDGEAFEALQYFLLDLKRRGILLAVCSKNDFENAVLPFRKHPDMILKEEDITVFVANWESKAENIKTIRETLNIGFDSMVFLDDNPFERGVVRDQIPEMIVPELPEDPSLYVKTLAELNLFETSSYSRTDADRSEMYRDEARRKLSQKSFTTPEDYLQSLEMKILLSRFDPFHLPRIAQLIQRSNQFNLRTRRFTQAVCEDFMRDEGNYYPFYVKLKDKYGDNGLISVVILKVDGDALMVEEWIMSCRVLARGVEQHTMNHVFEFAAKRGLKRVVGSYVPSPKNKMVREFFKRFGFEKTADVDGATTWSLNVADYTPKVTHMEIDQEEELVAGARGH